MSLRVLKADLHAQLVVAPLTPRAELLLEHAAVVIEEVEDDRVVLALGHSGPTPDPLLDLLRILDREGQVDAIDQRDIHSFLGNSGENDRGVGLLDLSLDL